jgi:hypothetical protein
MKNLATITALAAALLGLACASSKGSSSGTGGGVLTGPASTSSSVSASSSGSGGSGSTGSTSGSTSSGTSTSSSASASSTTTSSSGSSAATVVSCSAHTLGFGATDLTAGIGQGGPVAVVRTDFNSDGLEDLAVLYAATGTVTVLLRFGDGTFATPQSYNLGLAAEYFEMVAADFNSDGHPDLAVVGQSGMVQVLAGSSNGTLTPETPISLMGAVPASGFITADFNGDGKPDLVVFGNFTGQIAILTNTGAFTFSESDFPFAKDVEMLAAADVDGDMRVDLVAARGGATELVVLLNKMAGFSPLAPVALPESPTALVVTDLNADGKVDALVGCLDGSVQLLLGSGGGMFGAAISVGNAPEPNASIVQLGTGDVTGDGHPDIVALTTATLMLVPSTGVGAWGSPAFFNSGAPGGLLVGDLNGDDHADVVVCVGENDVTVLLAAPETLLAGPTLAYTTQFFSAPIMVDVNGDGHLDVVALSTETGEVGVFMNNGDGTLAKVVTYGVGTAAEVATGDFNGDGHVDLAVANPNLGSIGVLLGTANGFGPVKQIAAPNVRGVVVGDFNNDSKLDLLAYGGGGITFIPGTGTGTFGAAIPQNTQTIDKLLVAKVNKDQTLDLVGITSAYDGPNPVVNAITLLGNGDGTFGGGTTVEIASLPGNSNSLYATAIAVGDFDNDTNTDVAVYVEYYIQALALNTASLWFLAGDGTGNLAIKQQSYPFLTGIVTGDFDGDGNLDLAYAGGESKNGIGIMLGNGAWSFTNSFFRSTTLLLQPGLAAGDLVGDGRPSLFFGESLGVGEMLNLCK